MAGADAQGRAVVTILPGSFSARIAELAAADGLVVIPAEAAEVRAGETLEFLPF